MTTTTSVEFTIRCDDRRYCDNCTIKIFTAFESTKSTAHKIARGNGWIIRDHDAAQCPDCQQGQYQAEGNHER